MADFAWLEWLVLATEGIRLLIKKLLPVYNFILSYLTVMREN
jgi:hypothetical protein